tara:strand:+ start:419 stop:661 length:243 start_codon:yes stop_codon:yes gene_type:complete
MNKSYDLKLNCKGCIHFFVTYDKFRPWGCRKFGFKGKNLPAQIVYLTTGMQCAYYETKPKIDKKFNYEIKNNSKIVDLEG